MIKIKAILKHVLLSLILGGMVFVGIAGINENKFRGPGLILGIITAVVFFLNPPQRGEEPPGD